MSDNEWEEEEFASNVSSKTLWRMLGLTRAHWPWLVAFLVTVATTAALDSLFNYFKKLLIDSGITPGDTAALAQVIGWYGAAAVVQAVTVFGFIFFAGYLGEQLQYDLRQKMFNHLQELSFAYFDRTPVGWLMSRVTSDSDKIASLVTWGLLDVVWAGTSILSAAFFMLYLNWRLALVVCVVIPILVVIAARFQKYLLGEYRSVRKANSKITGAYNETITGVRVVKALNREEANLSEFSALTGQMYHASFRAAWMSALFLPLVQLINAGALGGVAWMGGHQVLAGALTLGDLQAFIGYIAFMMWPVQDLARVYAELQHAVASAERTFSLIDAQPEVTDQPGARDPGPLRGEIAFEHVDFFYAADKPVLHDFNLMVQPGETIAFVGPTGGGKSTIVNLLCRFYEPKRGVIRLNGRDYTEWTMHGIQSRIGVVLQTPHLFTGSIRENIRYGRLNATVEEIEAAALVAGAHAFILKLEKGYETNVGEGGNLLSVGQKQLISLARAVLAQPDLLIMDEATSSVDTVTESLIQQGMERLMHGRTSFVIAHRLSTIKRASRIVVIEQGRITEMGTHAELLRQRGHYHNLYTRQFRRELERTYELGKMTGLVEVNS